MKILLKNDFKIRKKFIIVYLIFIAMIFVIKSLGLYTKELSFFGEKPFALLFLVAILLHYILYVISSEGMIIDKSKPYILTLGASRADIINVKFLKVLSIFIIDGLLMTFILQNVELNGFEFKVGLFITIYVMAYYLISIPIYLYFGQTSGVGTIFTSSPALLPLLDRLGRNPAGFFLGIIKRTSSLKLTLFLLAFVITIYIISRLLGERKDY
ncbi:MAG: ABC-2 transporter permease [Peptoniphilus sp.]|mgnify:FL=1|uniref:ABC-2 transporter permease n=1 Tax=Peptoniphilus genitalis TaxID=3036303 RepID=A0ABY4TQZ8_9FIRM|nr:MULTISPECIES: ABC-2 transporter permease [Peptoniphilus]MDK7377556.1 ABC-2 transporter permease [Peptoniphilus harei]MDK7679868.1 ABC-2 transporter permease [Peptoniphilus harei]MDU2503332.1 ABC-2 transporter permease [Peptoniphilus harei]MDU3457588.1 ABC-2 transporter permease [Peptoniphilus harei]MDU5184798.1 ABC-2 transporter permease [Peptoniphilus harei]